MENSLKRNDNISFGNITENIRLSTQLRFATNTTENDWLSRNVLMESFCFSSSGPRVKENSATLTRLLFPCTVAICPYYSAFNDLARHIAITTLCTPAIILLPIRVVRVSR